ncbi:MAG: hypothetical protein AABY96_15265 [Nitrospirota bacterium]
MMTRLERPITVPDITPPTRKFIGVRVRSLEHVIVDGRKICVWLSEQAVLASAPPMPMDMAALT